MYFTSRHIPHLQGLKYIQRMQVIKLALSYLTAPQKIILNIIKLTFLIPIFMLLANIQSDWSFVYLMLVGLGYPLVTNPISFHFANKHIEQARSDFDEIALSHP